MKWLAPLLLLAGCAGPLGALRVVTPLKVGDQAFTLRSTPEASADTHRIKSALAKATPGLKRWGGLKEPVTVFIVDSHAELESAVRRHGFTWLRAWGRYDDVIFQAPSTWTTKDEFVEQLVLHELTHCLLFQRSGTRDTWYLKNIPLWFREGMAIFTAGQAKLYPSLEDSARWLQQNPTLDAFRNGEELSEAQSTEVYGLGLHAFEFLLRRYGEAHLNALMSTMREGGDFEAAFDTVVGISVERFQKDFENYLRLRAFRGGGRRRFSVPPTEAAPRPLPGTE